ncbi:hypothetical protein PJP07_31195, partial [Mycobacterium kansasii]
RCTFIGCEQHDFGYRFWNTENKKIIRSKDVFFNEKVRNKDGVQQNKADEKEFVELEELPDTGVVVPKEHYEAEPQTPVV